MGVKGYRAVNAVTQPLASQSLAVLFRDVDSAWADGNGSVSRRCLMYLAAHYFKAGDSVLI